ncbi:Zinc finger, C2H2-type/integrase, DNA-binding protein [Akanthomyces lecanii RCEF 1005]|uniref:Zinc finger, C2H2-type/integrase, DNA-binding protein n=1 Tax=Akanthomyces lecanii RCEF 1005 TaxID=1081108 RepID=A0A168KTM9_CORDF|nr:Zinc finger, C2H2-type/integrase, DNA-binding protein [Akanthomyces lecanii RCEF 1005]
MEDDAAHMAFSGPPSNDMAAMALDLDNLPLLDMSLSHGLDPFAAGFHDDSCLDHNSFNHCSITTKSHASAQKAPAMAQRSLSQTHTRQRHSISNPTPAANPSSADHHQQQTFPSPWDTYFNNTMLQNSMSCVGFDVCQENECAASVCNSECDASCPSQCDDKDHGVCCDDDACGPPDLCVDQDCKVPAVPCSQSACPISDNEAAAAAALTSFGDKGITATAPATSSHTVPPTPSIADAGYLDLPTVPCSSLSLDNSFGNTPAFSGQMWDIAPEFILANHIMQYHDPTHHENHMHSCIADKPSTLMQMCSLPKHSPTPDGISPHGVDAICGFQIQDPYDFAQHIFQQHRPALMANGNNIHRTLQNASSHHMLDDHHHHHHNHFSSTTSPSTNLSLATSLSPTPASLPTPSTIEGTNYFADMTSAAAESTPSASPEDQNICRWLIPDGMGGNRICGHRSSDHKSLQDHCKADHLKQIKKDHAGFYCQWQGCTRNTTFSQRSKLERHMQVHTGYKPVQCHICGASLSAKQSLEQHMRTHTGEKPWVCSFEGCNQSFKQQSALTMHERTHTGAKPLQCDICGKKFGESSNLSKHRRIHNIRGSHVCEICGKDFHRLDQLRRHMGTNHKDKPEEVSKILSRVKTGRISKPNIAVMSGDGLGDFEHPDMMQAV